MRVIKTSGNGIVNHETIFHFRQKDQVVSSNYSGGKILEGTLIGLLDNNVLHFTYCQLLVDGEMNHGESKCVVSKDPMTGKIRMEEKFEMRTGASVSVGTNVFMEL